ncbi:hypothetical protein VNO78_30442 [Psophocarpus tetragonolobus]|uniref:Kinesin motor domain-containing protein n=1 Tax=Psophocarpus tetragonolobus TaxID=3891 RepID=A0AAN9RWW9_PSOTE
MEKIHVSVRAKPLSEEDEKASLWKISGNSISIPNHSIFEFDRIFSENCATAQVYEARTKDIVEAAVCGFNGTVFAYGQTNSGKTYTMRGSKSEPGVIPLAVRDLFQIIQQVTAPYFHFDVDREFLLRMSYMEIYNEEINDLLAPEHRKLQIHENLERGIYVAGLREEIVASPEQVLGLMEAGESHRHIGETNMNLYSSRSHTIFRMIIESRDRSVDEESGSSCDAVRVSVLNLVDLAGSERAAKTGAEGVRLKEGSHINKSLMTLGTVIKKLSEGAESQGGHVPYRDSKLTRILQPSLGGNAKTAIICNITLAQIHTDETKSSLQFASRALRVTNCAQVNEILTDAALLKRQKKEIEDLRAKLMGSQSEHLEQEILHLRNTLLQTELERERIALELEEEKKTLAGWEKIVKEQAKKIENLSSMVLFSNRDENREHSKKVYPSIQPSASTTKPTRPKRDMGPLLPFGELVNEEVYVDESFKQEDDNKDDANKDCNLPNPCALLHVTNRKKASLRKRSLSMEDNKFLELQAEYESLFVKFETQRTVSEIQIEALRKQLIEAQIVNFGESDAIFVIKRLQEQIKILEMKNLSSQQNLDNVVDLATEQNICAREKCKELYEELVNAQEAARLANEKLTSAETEGSINDGNFDFLISVSTGIEEIVTEIQNSKEAVQSVTFMVDDAIKNFSALCEILLILLDNQLADLQKHLQESKLDAQNSQNSLMENLEQQKFENAELISYIQTLENDLFCLTSSSVAKDMETLRKDLEKAKNKLKETESKLKIVIQEKTKLEGEKAFAEREIKRLLGQNALLERDINKRDSLAGRRHGSIVERGSKMFDSKRPKGLAFTLEQTLQEENKKLEVSAFESETKIASLEEEITAILREKEEMISINEGLMSELEGLTEKLNTSTSELHNLKEEISALKQRLEESDITQENLKSSIKVLMEEKEELALQLTDSLLEIEEERAIWSAKEKAALLAIEEHTKSNSVKIASLSMELLEARNELESCREECRILKERWTIRYENANIKEKFSSIEFGKSDSLAEINLAYLKKDLSLATSEEHRFDADQCGMQSWLDAIQGGAITPLERRGTGRHDLENVSELDQLENRLETTYAESKQSRKMSKVDSEMQALEQELRDCPEEEKENEPQKELHVLDEGDNLSSSNEFQKLKNKLSVVTKEKDKLTIEMEDQQKKMEFLQDEFSKAKVHAEVLSQQLHVLKHKELAMFRMRLRATQTKLDAFRYRHREAVDELDSMKKKYKEQLASKGLEVLDLMKQLAEAKGQ